MSCVLLTGFEPFADRPLNVSAAAVAYLREHLPAGIDLHCALLPVTADQAPARISAALREIRPDVCLMLGQADGLATLAVERVALNLCDFRIADNGGLQLRDAPVVEGGPAAYFATVPTRAMVEAAQASGTPAGLSLSAGAFICNMVFYAALHTCAQQRLPTRCGFIHLPLLPIQVIGERPAPPSMDLETIAKGLRAMIELLRS
ncbi:MAG: pyroglutamyl-peptidase I [Roseiflexaceae bacterium]